MEEATITCHRSSNCSSPTYLTLLRKNQMKVVSGDLRAHCVRLNPGDDLVASLLEAAKLTIARHPGSNSCCILTCVGSLDQVTLRMANASRDKANEVKSWLNMKFEIVSLVGTLTGNGEKHLHLCISDASGTTFGGHLMSARVFTTAELVLGTMEGVSFDRVHDDATGFKELQITESISIGKS